MTKVFADSFYYFALGNPHDPAHARALEFTRTYTGLMLTTQWVITEVADGVARPDRWRKWFVDLYAKLVRDPKVRIVPFSEQLFTDGLTLYANRPDKTWSLTDCVSFVVMEQEGIKEALTGDHHFEQAGFVALLK